MYVHNLKLFQTGLKYVLLKLFFCFLCLCRFANNKIVRVYSLVLADYHSNGDTTNNAVVKMLYHISSDLKMVPLLYHISVFRTLLAIMNEPPAPRFKVQKIDYISHLLKFVVGVMVM